MGSKSITLLLVQGKTLNGPR